MNKKVIGGRRYMTQSVLNKTGTWNANLYDGRHTYVSKYGESLLEWLQPKKGEKICDVGCGTGDLAQKISGSGATVVGVDSSASMVDQATKKYSNVSFQVQDVRKLPFSNEFDAVFSNATLHWVKESDQAVASIWQALKLGGRFVTEFGGKDNIKLIVEGINSALDQFGFSQNKSKNPWRFLSVGEYTSILEKQGFIVREVVYYDRPTELDEDSKGLRNWVDMFASFFFEGVPDETYEKMLLHIENELRPHLFEDGKWYADYKRLRIKAEKPNN